MTVLEARPTAWVDEVPARNAINQMWSTFREALLHSYRQAFAALNRRAVTTLVVASRRALIVYHLIRLAGLDGHRLGRVLSDRFLALQASDPAAQAEPKESVWLLDDSSVSGDAKVRLRMTARQRWSESSIVDDVHVALSFDKANWDDSAELQRQYAMAFSRAVIPPFGDAPITCEVTSGADFVAQLCTPAALRNWDLIDVTNTAIAADGGRNYALFLREELLSGFRGYLGPVANLVSLVKIRLYTFADNLSQCRWRAVPLVQLHEQPEGLIKSWLEAIGLAHHGPDQVKAGMALLSYSFSRALLEFLNTTLDASGESIAERWFGDELKEDEAFAQVAMTDTVRQAAHPRQLVKLSSLINQPVLDWISPSFSHIVPGWEELRPVFVSVGDSLRVNATNELVALLVPALEMLPKKRGQVVALTEFQALMSQRLHWQLSLAEASVLIDVLHDLGFAVPVFEVRSQVGETSTPSNCSVAAPGLQAMGMVVGCYRLSERAHPIDSLTSGKLAAFAEMWWERVTE